MIKLKRIAILEQPGWRKDEISMLNLDEFILLLAQPGVVHTIRPQCPFGAKVRVGLDGEDSGQVWRSIFLGHEFFQQTAHI